MLFFPTFAQTSKNTDIMKRTFLLLLSFVSLVAQAQNYTNSKVVLDHGITYNVRVAVNLPHATPQLDSILCKDIFGTEGTLKEGYNKYFSKYQNTAEQPKVNIDLYVREEFCNEETGMLCVTYVVPGEERVADCSKEKYVTYDLKNAKQVLLEDLVNDELKRHLTSQGIDTKSVSNIYTFGQVYVARAASSDIRMTPYKLYKYMSDYGLALVGLDRKTIETGLAAGDGEDETKIYTSEGIQKLPQFPGGTDGLIRYLSTNIKYPRDAQEHGIQGRVMCSFVVEPDGSISNVEIIKSIPELDAEAIRVISSMPNWIPGTNTQGRYVRVKYTIPIMFRLG